MNRGISPNSMTYEINQNGNTQYRDSLIQQDILSQLKIQVFTKDQNRQNYENLLAKYHKLQEDMERLIQMRNQHEISLRQQQNDERNLLINELKNKNDELSNQLNNQIAINKKLYNENNLMFKELELKKNENQNLQDEIIRQEDFLHRLSYEKDEIEKKIYNLNQMRERQEMEIINCNEEINNLNYKNNGQGNLIRSRSDENINIYNEINNEKIINQNLMIELRDKENNYISNQQELNMANENIHGLESDINNLTNLLNRNNDDIDIVNNNLIKETETTNKLISDNNNISNYINERDAEIENIKNENDLLKQNNKDMDIENNNMNTLLEKYKQHLILLVIQNKKLSSEIQLLLGRDSEMKTVLDRTDFLKDFRQENDKLISNSIENIKPHLDNSYQFENSMNNSTTIKKTYSLGGSVNIDKERENKEYNYEPKNIIYNLNEKNDQINRSQNIDYNINKDNDLKISKENNINDDKIGSEEEEDNNINNNINVDNNNEEHSEM